MDKAILFGLFGMALGGLAGCDAALLAPEARTALVSVDPAAGTADAPVDATVTVAFDGAMRLHAADYMAVHEGGVTGPTVDGSWTMHGDTALEFMPHAELHRGTHYTVHVGGGVTDARGDTVDLASHGPHMGGEWAADSMMMGSNGMHDGGHHDHPHMGAGWQHPETGSYGMLFTFIVGG